MTTHQEKVIEQAYAFADAVREAIGRDPRAKPTPGRENRCPLEAHINVVHLEVGSTQLCIDGPPEKKQALAAKLVAAGYEVDATSHFWGFTVQLPEEVKEFIALADSASLPPEYQGRWSN